jgi:hypothetical protein
VLVAIPLFERSTALDAVGPYEVLQRVPSIDVAFVGHQRGEVRSDNGMLGMMVDKAFTELTQPDDDRVRPRAVACVHFPALSADFCTQQLFVSRMRPRTGATRRARL